MVENLGKVKRLQPRTVWPNEASDFTPWLQQHMELLSAALGIDIQLVEREVAVGDFSVDLLGEEPGSGRAVVIENQLERTNHDHLGKLLTYAAGKDGAVIVWIATEIRSEHRNALDWLNNATRGNIDFYGVELELLQIGDSAMAPDFKVVVSPRSLESTSPPTQGGQPNDRQLRYQKFFEGVLARIQSTRPGITNASKVGYRSWISTPSGKGGFTFGLSFATGAKFKINLYIDTGVRDANKAAFDVINGNQELIESELETALSWERLDNRRASWIAWNWDTSVTVMDADEKLDKLQDWAIENYFKFRDALTPHLENI